MKDLSPEEVRWEMYHAQKNGMVEQAVSEFMPMNYLSNRTVKNI